MVITRGLRRLLKLTASTGPLQCQLQHRSPFICAMDSTTSIFKGVRDRYSGVTVSSEQEPVPASDLEQVLEASLHQWMNEKVRGVWFRVDLRHAEWVPILAKNGFVYHHAQLQFVMMVRWLPTSEPNNIPRYAHNVIGVGAFVVNDDGEVLVVRERFYARPHWKLPGGYVEPGEDLGEAAVREVLEETGVKAEFISVVAFRHVHGSAFGCSDIYFILHLRPSTRQIHMCSAELSACQWMKLEEYAHHPDVNKTNQFFAERFMECRRSGVKLGATIVFHPSFKRNIAVYSITSPVPGSEGVGKVRDKEMDRKNTEKVREIERETAEITERGKSSVEISFKEKDREAKENEGNSAETIDNKKGREKRGVDRDSNINKAASEEKDRETNENYSSSSKSVTNDVREKMTPEKNKKTASNSASLAACNGLPRL